MGFRIGESSPVTAILNASSISFDLEDKLNFYIEGMDAPWMEWC